MTIAEQYANVLRFEWLRGIDEPMGVRRTIHFWLGSRTGLVSFTAPWPHWLFEE